MEQTDLLASYKNGLHRASIYRDRVELGLGFGLPTEYPLDEIVAVNLDWGLFGSKVVSLALRNDKVSKKIGLPKTDALAFQVKIEEIIRDAKKELGIYFRCTYVGGSGTDLVTGLLCKAYFEERDVLLVCGDNRLRLPISQLSSFTIEGSGRQVTNAGVSGGGFGVEGALQGIGLAAMINTLTSKTTINTILYLAWPGAELFLHTSDCGLDEARLQLSHVFSLIGRKETNAVRIDNVDGIDIQIQRLSLLKDSGHLSDDEFRQAKLKVLNLI